MVRYSFNNLKNVVADFGLARNEVSASVREIFSERKKLLCQLVSGVRNFELSIIQDNVIINTNEEKQDEICNYPPPTL
jgi:hypothetical protein